VEREGAEEVSSKALYKYPSEPLKALGRGVVTIVEVTYMT
jgi:hypothetical protein